MSQAIKDLQAETHALETEINSLEQQLKKLKTNTPIPDNLPPSKLAEALKAAALETQSRLVDVQSVEEALEVLKGRLAPKRKQLAELEAERDRQQTLEFLESGKIEIREKAKEIEALSESFKVPFLELKELSEKYRAAFCEVHKEMMSDGHYTYFFNSNNISSLLNLRPISLPRIEEITSNKLFYFQVVGEPFDPYAEERAAAEAARIERETEKWRRLDAESARRKRDIFNTKVREEIAKLEIALENINRELVPSEQNRDRDWEREQRSQAKGNPPLQVFTEWNGWINRERDKVSKIEAEIAELRKTLIT